MLLDLPIIIYYEDEDSSSAELKEVSINPEHIASLEADSDTPAYSIMVLSTGYEYTVRLTVAQVKAKLRTYQKQNIISLYYNSMRGMS